MKKILSFVLIASIFIGLPLSAQAWGQRGQQTIGPTYRLQTDQLLLDPARVIGFVGQRPVVLATDESVLSLRPPGQTLSSPEGTWSYRLLSSTEGHFIGVLEMAPPEKSLKAPFPIIFTLYDEDGQRQWSLKQPVSCDDPLPSFYISNAGRVVMVEPADCVVSFFDQMGELDSKVQIFGDISWSNERPVSGAFCADGSRFAISALHHHSRPGDELSPRQKGQSFLVLFDERGAELWRRELASEISDRVAISDDGMTIAAAAHSVKGLNVVEIKTYLYDGQGELLGKLDLLFQHAVFSSQGKHLLLGQKNDLSLAEVSTAEAIWQTRLSPQAGQVRALDLSADGRLALVLTASSSYRGDGFVFVAPQAYLFDQAGHQVWSQKFPDDSFEEPAARFLDDGRRFLLAFQDRYLIYERDDQ